MARRRREPTIEVREHRCADGTLTEMWSVRSTTPPARAGGYVALQERRRTSSAHGLCSRRLGEPLAASVVAADDGSGLTLAGLWPMYRADAECRLARSTLREYERIWDRRLGPRLGRLRPNTIRPRLVSDANGTLRRRLVLPLRSRESRSVARRFWDVLSSACWSWTTALRYRPTRKQIACSKLSSVWS